MTDNEQKKLACELSAICVFRDILDMPPMKALIGLLSSDNKIDKFSFLGELVYSLQAHDRSLSEFIRSAVCSCENAYVTYTAFLATGSKEPSSLLANIKGEMRLLARLTRLKSEHFCSSEKDMYIPQFENTECDHISLYKMFRDRAKNIGKYGYGVFTQSVMFRVCDGDIVPVKAADNIASDGFIGYDEQRKKVYDNTRALISGRKAANILLFGDAGTGKSSTVKACANHFADEGVRLIELRRDQLSDIAAVMDRISDDPLKFIIFIDDLSFNKNDDSFSMLKAALEGSAAAKADNAVIYATSNRRHIVKESFSDRSSSDDIHRNDTMQELLSLSDRFGLTVYFEKPNKQLYLEIVKKLAEKNGITVDKDVLFQKAEAFALRKGNRSPRAAEQFINNILSEVNNYE